MADIENIKFGDLLENALNEALKDRGYLNILIAGNTGVGKSTLINSIFQGNLAETGIGRPITQEIREITKEGIPLSIFDTRGLEQGEQLNKILKDLRYFVKERCQDIDPTKHIHVAWVCILEDSYRVEKGEEALVKILEDFNVPVIGVITKARSDKGFRAEVQRILPSLINIVRVRAIPEDLDDGHILPTKGLPELVELTMQAVPKAFQRAFVAAQKVDIQLKKEQSQKIVALAAATAAAIGAVPIPFADAPILVTTQIGMIASITATFGLSIDQSFFSSILASVITAAGATLSGKAIVAELFKYFPVVGTFVGGMICSVTATGLTTAFGTAYIEVLTILFISNNGEPPTQEEILKEFKKKLTEN